MHNAEMRDEVSSWDVTSVLEGLVGLLSSEQTDAVIEGVANLLESVLQMDQWEDGLREALGAQNGTKPEPSNDCASRNDRRCNSACHSAEALTPCHGWRCPLDKLPGIDKLYRVGVPIASIAESGTAYGNYSLSYLWDTGDVLSLWPTAANYPSLSAFAQAEPDATHHLHEIAKHCMGPLYTATGSALRSTPCDELGPNGTCKHCACLQHVESIKRRARPAAAASVQYGAAVSPDDWHDILGKSNISGMDDMELRGMVHYWRGRALNAERDSFHKDRQIAILTAQLSKALEEAANGAAHHNYPKLLQNLIEAFNLGRLEVQEGSLMNKALEDILTGISITLKNATRQGRILSRDENLFYAELLNAKGPWAQMFVSKVLNGPDLRTSKRVRAALSVFYEG